MTRPGGLTVAYGPPDTTGPAADGDLYDPAEPDHHSGLPNGA